MTTVENIRDANFNECTLNSFDTINGNTINENIINENTINEDYINENRINKDYINEDQKLAENQERNTQKIQNIEESIKMAIKMKAMSKFYMIIEKVMKIML
ncbi:hypothetical protein LY90DRAFT_499281 [Neocallimastix californiae]|uniref:Uncharacterized protein n=1 Tax=Neocallimastix californiae TaxID=1754190 RepID=A0A1Y2FMW6_9FUNG|nr:hypothetical protein LY90DRAFT_499281 [Neocallimastix californiae]|eukprot:ORY84566.1 hypothetical protein LY90DRAFT_499281 [Neocallimastix californiae]